MKNKITKVQPSFVKKSIKKSFVVCNVFKYFKLLVKKNFCNYINRPKKNV